MENADTLDVLTLVELTEDIACLRTRVPKEIGTTIHFDVKLPGNLGTFLLCGTLTHCKRVNHYGSDAYKWKLKLGPLLLTEKKILKAYVEYLERVKIIEEAFSKLRLYEEAIKSRKLNNVTIH